MKRHSWLYLLLISILTLTVQPALAQFPPDPGSGPLDPPPLPPGGGAPSAYAEIQILQDGQVRLDGSSSIDPDGDALVYAWFVDNVAVGTGSIVDVTLPPGEYVILLRVMDTTGLTGEDQVLLTLDAADAIAPEIQVQLVKPGVLWPPNGKLVKITLGAVAVDDTDPAPVLRIKSVTSNQPLTSREVIVTGDLGLKLAARRTANLGERVYSVTLEAVDASGNASEKVVSIVVPKSMGKKK